MRLRIAGPEYPTPTATSSTATSPSATGPTPTPIAAPPDHLLVIVLENTEYSSVIGNTGQASYLNGPPTRYALATSYFASAHPSLPNDLELMARSTFGLDGSDCPSCSVHGTALVDELAVRNIGWTAYMEGLPSPCFNGAAEAGPHPYARKHDPAD